MAGSKNVIVLSGWDEFRTIKWDELFEFPSVSARQIEALLGTSNAKL